MNHTVWVPTVGDNTGRRFRQHWVMAGGDLFKLQKMLGHATVQMTMRYRLQNLIRGNVDPVVIGLQVCAVSGWQDKHVLVVRAPNSLAAPHMITQGSGQRANSRFYLRHGAGKQPMDVSEIRSAFLRSDGQRGQLRRLREERIDAVLTDQTPALLKAKPQDFRRSLVAYLQKARPDFWVRGSR